MPPVGAGPAPRPRLEGLRYLLFALRCAGAASLSLALAEWVGLSFPVWAALSALVVSQERLVETRASFAGRMLGTLVGLGVAVTVHLAVMPLGVGLAPQLPIAVAVAAAFARRWPKARACTWTAAIVLVSPSEGATIPAVALLRGAEVALGGLVGALAHAAADAVLALAARHGRRK